VAAGYALSHTLEWPMSLWWLSRSTRVSTRRLVEGALRLSTLVAIGCVLGFLTVRGIAGLGLGPVVQVLGDIVVTVAVYAVAAAASKTVRRDITDLLEIVHLLRRRRGAAA
jgi:PST family polysaccharide transporter